VHSRPRGNRTEAPGSPGLGRGILFEPRQDTAPHRQPTTSTQRNCWRLLSELVGTAESPHRPAVIDVAPIQLCDVDSFGSGPQCAWTLEDIPGFLIAFHTRPLPQIPRSDLPHGGRSRPDTTLLRMNHCQPWPGMLRSHSRRLPRPDLGRQKSLLSQATSNMDSSLTTNPSPPGQPKIAGIPNTLHV
jgi:hypothetical protein